VGMEAYEEPEQGLVFLRSLLASGRISHADMAALNANPIPMEVEAGGPSGVGQNIAEGNAGGGAAAAPPEGAPAPGLGAQAPGPVVQGPPVAGQAAPAGAGLPVVQGAPEPRTSAVIGAELDAAMTRLAELRAEAQVQTDAAAAKQAQVDATDAEIAVSAANGRASGSRPKLPALTKWASNSSAKGRRADTFLDDIETYVKHDAQALTHELMLKLQVEPEVRESWERICRKWVQQGTQPTWAEVRLAFKRMVGQEHDLSAENAMRLFIDRKVVMADGATVATYRIEFESKLALVENMSEPMAAMYFVQGLRPALRSACQTDALGKAFTTVDTACAYATGKELEQDVACGAKPRTVAALNRMQNGGGGRGRGGGRGGGRHGGRGGDQQQAPAVDHQQLATQQMAQQIAAMLANNQAGFGRGGSGRGGYGRGGGRNGGGRGGGQFGSPDGKFPGKRARVDNDNMSGKQCFNCGKYGHFANVCPTAGQGPSGM
jgi:hypothetical protein